MSKVKEAKKEQGYVSEPRSCGTCDKLSFEIGSGLEWIKNIGYVKVRENKRCGIGGFAVEVNSSCDKYEKEK